MFLAALAVVAVNGQRGGRRRQGRQEAQAEYGAPPQAQYGEPQADASSLSDSHSGDHEGLDWLLNSVPGTPGEDYPILAEVPETAFSCDGQVEGGKQATCKCAKMPKTLVQLLHRLLW